MLIEDLRRRLVASKGLVRFYLDLVRYGERPRVVEPPRARQVVVLAPHPDDEAIGCGGIISTYRLSETPVTVVHLTDGGRRTLGSSELSSSELIAVRRKEAMDAAAVLGGPDLAFLDIPDGLLHPAREYVEKLASLLARLRPDLVLLPFLTDQHRDHFQTNALFVAASDALGDSQVECWGYEVWTPVYANRLVDITAVAEKKWEALRTYKSQAKHLDYLGSVMGLNRFRQRTAYRQSGYAEAFFATGFRDYQDLFLRMNSR